MSEAPARRSPISSSAPRRCAGPVIGRVMPSSTSTEAPIVPQVREPFEAVLEDRLVDAARPARLGEQHAGGRLEVGRETRERSRRDVRGDVVDRCPLTPRTSMRSSVRLTSTPTRSSVSRKVPRSAQGAPLSVTFATRDRCRDDERAGLDAIGDDVVGGTAQAPSALDLDRVGRRPLDLGAHRREEPR